MVMHNVGGAFAASYRRARAVQTRMADLRADTLIGAIALRSFLSLVPLIVVAIAVLGFLAQGDADLVPRMTKALKLTGELEVTFDANVERARVSRRSTSVFGVLFLAWAGSGLFSVLAQANDAVWQVPTRGLKDKAAGVLWALGAAVFLAVIAVGVGIIQLVHLPLVGLVTGFGVGFLAGTGLFWWTQKIFTNVSVPARAFLPGAIVGGIALAFFQVVGSYVLPHLVASASELYASLATVVALLAFQLIIARLLVLAAVVSVVWWESAHGTVALPLQAPAIPGDNASSADRAGQRAKPISESLPTKLWKRLGRGR